MAYNLEHFFPGLCVHTFGRKPLRQTEKCEEPFPGLAAYRFLAWRELELRFMGAVLFCVPFDRKGIFGEGFGENPAVFWAYLCFGSRLFWVDPVPLREHGKYCGYFERDVRGERKRGYGHPDRDPFKKQFILYDFCCPSLYTPV